MPSKHTLFSYADEVLEGEAELLGLLAWYTVPEDAEVEHSTYVRLVEMNNAPIRTPAVPKPANVFRRACKAAKITKVPTDNPDIFHNYVLRDAGYETNFVFRRIIEETIDSSDHEIAFRDLGQAIFEKSGVSATYKRTIAEDDPALPYWDNIVAHIDNYVQTRMMSLPAIVIREGARKGLELKLNGVKVRDGGGVYFVAPDKLDKLKALDVVVNAINSCTFHILPVIDDQRQRSMLREAFENETVEDMDTLVGEITTLLRSDKNIPVKKFLEIQKRYNEKREKLDEYTALLNETMERSATAVELCGGQLKALLDKATA